MQRSQLPLIPKRAESFEEHVELSNALKVLPGKFGFNAHSERLDLFSYQHGHYEGTLWGVECGFYELLHVWDLFKDALFADYVLSARGIEMGRRPFLSVVVDIFPSLYDADAGLAPMPEPDETTIGKHIVAIYGHRSGAVRFLNNWGEEWGDHGFGWFSFDYIERYFHEGWSHRRLVGPAIEKGYATDRSPARAQENYLGFCRHPWDQATNSRFEPVYWSGSFGMMRRSITGSNGRFYWQYVAVRLTEIAPFPIIVGWAHLHCVDGRFAVEEFFVWPPYRHKGVGSALAGLMLQQLLLDGHQVEFWLCPEADAVEQERADQAERLPTWLRTLTWEEAEGRPYWIAPVDHIQLLTTLAKYPTPAPMK
jgi:GNAT superfamily N-acetyltransferase